VFGILNINRLHLEPATICKANTVVNTPVEAYVQTKQ